jgi:hypothetical protein
MRGEKGRGKSWKGENHGEEKMPGRENGSEGEKQKIQIENEEFERVILRAEHKMIFSSTNFFFPRLE